MRLSIVATTGDQRLQSPNHLSAWSPTCLFPSWMISITDAKPHKKTTTIRSGQPFSPYPAESRLPDVLCHHHRLQRPDLVDNLINPVRLILFIRKRNRKKKIRIRKTPATLPPIVHHVRNPITTGQTISPGTNLILTLALTHIPPLSTHNAPPQSRARPTRHPPSGRPSARYGWTSGGARPQSSARG